MDSISQISSTSRLHTTSTASNPNNAIATIKGFLSSLFVLLMFSVIIVTIIIVEPRHLAGNVTSLTVGPERRMAFNLTQSEASFDFGKGSHAYGRAGGVRHFLYGKLPEMATNRLTEPSRAQANYLHYECGKPDLNTNGNEIVETGRYQNTTWNKFPWAVRIVVKSKSHEDLIGVCSGSFITQQWVLTARHCYVHDKDFKFLVMIPNQDETPELIEIDSVHPYPGYDDIYNQNDFMLIKLKHFPKTPTHPVCLPNIDVIPATGRLCVFAGWPGGYIDSSNLEEMWVELDDPNSCQSRYCGIKYDVNKNICDKTMPGRQDFPVDEDHCHGFSGSALTCHEHGRWVAYGVLNWSGARCDVTKGRGYALTSTRLDWICCFVLHIKWGPCLHIKCGQMV
ncbi:chymotrypsin B-like [Ciona intestinalis]